MKKYVSGLCFLVLFSCQEGIGDNSKAIKEEIKAVVIGETQAYMEKDYEKWASYWDHGPDVLRLDVTKAGFAQSRGWENSGGNLKAFFEENPEPITSIFKNSNYLIFYDETLAWVAFDQTWTTRSGEETKAKATITLVRNQKAWKIISYTAIQYESEAGDVDTLGRE